MSLEKFFTTLVLAGRRGPTDPVAQAAGCSHKALVPIAGVPMLVRVLRELRAVPHVKQIAVSIDDPATPTVSLRSALWLRTARFTCIPAVRRRRRVSWLIFSRCKREGHYW